MKTYSNQQKHKSLLRTDINKYLTLFEKLNLENIELELANQKLLLLNEELKHYATVVKDLAISRERIRFAQDTHDTLGQTLILLISLLETGVIVAEGNPAVKEILTQALTIAREGLSDLRRSISGLKSQKLQINNLMTALHELVQIFNSIGIAVKLFVVDSAEYAENETYTETIYRICQEALTNSLRHGRAKNVSIVLRFTGNMIRLQITDDGVGCENMVKGCGISGMEQRVRDLNGDIRFQSNTGTGFSIMVEIPYQPIESNDLLTHATKMDRADAQD
ncbi:MAG: sensor histidine kinase [Firmicutes bacterium]|nr:sensor histidine kinase [Bacillota bacterium]